MNKFILKSFLFSIIIVSTIVWLEMSHKKSYDIKNDYMASIIDKHKRLADLNDNRLLLVGGSSLAFGINSQLIEHEININVINLGIHSGLGLEFLINEATESIKKGDIVLLSLEYPLYNADSKPDIQLIHHTQEIYPQSEAYFYFNLKDKLSFYLQDSRKRFNNTDMCSDPVYNRQNFNKYGDLEGHLKEKSRKELYDKEIMKDIRLDENIVNHLYKLYSRCHSLNAKLYILFPNFPTSEFNKNRDVILGLEKDIKLKLNFIPTLNKPETFVFDDSLFYDTVYHLNAKGREKRTKMLIEILKPIISNKK